MWRVLQHFFFFILRVCFQLNKIFHHLGTWHPRQDSCTSNGQHPPSTTQPQQEAAIFGHIQRVHPPPLLPLHYSSSTCSTKNINLTPLWSDMTLCPYQVIFTVA